MSGSQSEKAREKNAVLLYIPRRKPTYFFVALLFLYIHSFLFFLEFIAFEVYIFPILQIKTQTNFFGDCTQKNYTNHHHHFACQLFSTCATKFLQELTNHYYHHRHEYHLIIIFRTVPPLQKPS